ncbi:MAG: L-erythro-3,5-diaminohexanoate dehydrogenase [Candidatus Calescibacterium sp.]|nr:L-erythro-3,5-diaminohexanoate dehydrogenase [Candidatus Calescibacterium sp.]
MISDLKIQLEFLGIHRSVEPKNVLPQSANVVDNSLPIFDSEILFEINSLNIDSASFKNLLDLSGGSKEKLKELVFEIVKSKGKMHNPYTNSGGVFRGVIKQMGKYFKEFHGDKYDEGSNVVSLTSLTFTPLYIEKVLDVDIHSATVYVEGYAILFLNSPFAIIDDVEFDYDVVMKVLDVAGAPAQVARYCKISDYVVILGAGKSAILSAYEAYKRVKPTGKVFVISKFQEELDYFKNNDLCDYAILCDVTNPVDTFAKYLEISDRLADLVVNCTNVSDTEAATILLTRDGGKAYFFSMATSFQKAALQAEGLAKNIELIIGNGYYPEHYKIALNCLNNKAVYEFFRK